MANNITTSLTGSVAITDGSTNVTPFNLVLSGLGFIGTVALPQYLSIPNAPTAVVLPVAVAQFVYIKNLHATQTLTVTWTPNTGASAVVTVLAAGSAIILCESAVTALGGISVLSLQGSGAATTCEVVIGG